MERALFVYGGITKEGCLKFWLKFGKELESDPKMNMKTWYEHFKALKIMRSKGSQVRILSFIGA